MSKNTAKASMGSSTKQVKIAPKSHATSNTAPPLGGESNSKKKSIGGYSGAGYKSGKVAC